MNFLKTLFWIVVTIVVVVFSFRNWVPVTVNLFGDVQVDVKLPVLLGLMFLLGFLPAYAWLRVLKWRAGRRRAIDAPLATAPADLPVDPTPELP